MAELEREILSFDPSREIDREIKLPFGGGQMSNPSVAKTNQATAAILIEPSGGIGSAQRDFAPMCWRRLERPSLGRR